MVVTVQEVRFFLKNLPEDFVSDETIEIQITQATWVVDKEKSAAASDEDLDKVILIRSAFYSTLAYMEEAERSLGMIPPGLAVLANALKTETDMAMKYIQRGEVYSIPLAVATLSDSAWDYVGSTDISLSTDE